MTLRHIVMKVTNDTIGRFVAQFDCLHLTTFLTPKLTALQQDGVYTNCWGWGIRCASAPCTHLKY